MSRLLNVEDDPTQGNAMYTICKARALLSTGLRPCLTRRICCIRIPSCFMLNLMQPSGSGENILLSIRKRFLPRPILPGHARARERTRLMRARADEFLNKPHALYELFARIYNATRRQSSPRFRKCMGRYTRDRAAVSGRLCTGNRGSCRFELDSRFEEAVADHRHDFASWLNVPRLRGLPAP